VTRRRFPTATNYRGNPVGVWLGAAFTAAVVVVALSVALANVGAKGSLVGWGRDLLWMTAGIVAVFCAGLYDDYRPARTRGLARQLRALMAGELTSGIVKLVVIALAAALVVWKLGARDARLVLGIPVVSASANLWNLLDVAPGRALKWFIPVTLTLAIADGEAAYAAIAAAGLAAGALALPVDLRERAMLGDAGSNVLGFIVGVGLVKVVPVAGLAAVLVALLAIHVVAETVTLSRVIEAVPPLRWFDQLGRMRAEAGEGHHREDSSIE
jgi:UDP-GlcNAc:undecaprenyl-phosphate/decaprenyl-phosphate GlcNAc-1-phosphate transferase